MRRWLSIVLILIAITLGSLLGVLNTTPAAIDLLFIKPELPLGLALTIALAAGLLLGAGMLWLFRIVPLQRRLRRLQRKSKSAGDHDVATAPADPQQPGNAVVDAKTLANH